MNLFDSNGEGGRGESNAATWLPWIIAALFAAAPYVGYLLGDYPFDVGSREM